MKTLEKYAKLLARIKAEIERIAPDVEIILYGSVARGDSSTSSDIDLLILTNHQLSLQEERAITRPLYNIELETGIEINPLIRTNRQWNNRPFRTPFYCNVMNEGIRL